MSVNPNGKVLFVFCDATSADGNVSSVTGDGVQEATNVLCLSRAILPLTADGRRQIVFYQSGVASEADYKGEAIVTSDILQLAFGEAVASKIRDAYAFISQNFEEGDEICIFGFSRGAYTARKLAGLIDKIGLLETESLGNFFDIWKDLLDGNTPTIPAGTRSTRIRCVGVFDTVGSVLGYIDALSIKDTYLPPTIDVALHGLSLQENRKGFLPTLWTIPTVGLAKLPGGDSQILKQIWFPGAHPDVGGAHAEVAGTYNGRELADISLAWMVGEIQAFVNLDPDFIRRCAQPNPQPWGTTQPHNTYEEMDLPERAAVGHETRLESGQITAGSIFHPSLNYAPTTLTDPTYMVTLPILQKQFGPDWTPTYSVLNAFEVTCRTNWGKPPPKTDASGKPAGVPRFASAAKLIRGQH